MPALRDQDPGMPADVLAVLVRAKVGTVTVNANNLWGLLRAGLRQGLDEILRKHQRRCDERWSLKGRTVWIVDWDDENGGGGAIEVYETAGEASLRTLELTQDLSISAGWHAEVIR